MLASLRQQKHQETRWVYKREHTGQKNWAWSSDQASSRTLPPILDSTFVSSKISAILSRPSWLISVKPTSSRINHLSQTVASRSARPNLNRRLVANPVGPRSEGRPPRLMGLDFGGMELESGGIRRVGFDPARGGRPPRRTG